MGHLMGDKDHRDALAPGLQDDAQDVGGLLHAKGIAVGSSRISTRAPQWTALAMAIA